MATTKISRTSSSTGNRRTWTFSGWFKKCSLAVMGGLFATYTDSNNRLDFGFDASDKFFFKEKVSSSTNIDFTSTQTFRDTSSFYHLVIAVDTTQATNTNRVKVYVNGEQITTWVDSTYPAEDYDTLMNLTGRTYILGSKTGSADYWNGLMAHVHLVDGTALTPATFGETDSTSGIWKPKTAPSVTYGTNGFFLKFENSGAMGTDSSGQSNTLTVSGTLTQNVDTPSNNFCTMNPLASYYSASTFTNGNNTVTTTSGAHDVDTSTLAVGAGLWYYEAKLLTAPDGNCLIGIQSQPQVDGELGEDTYSYGLMCSNGNIIGPSSASASYGVSVSAGDVVGVYIDLTANKLYFAKAGVIMNSGTGFSIVAPASQTTLPAATNVYFPACGDASSSSAFVWQFNFGSGYFGTTAVTSAVADAGGEGLFEYDPSAGTFDSASKDFRAICTKNIKEFG